VIALRRPVRAYCEADRWTFDPRYTQGKCPICGWAPAGVPSAPRWLALVNRLDWEVLGLFLLVDVLVLFGLIVAHAAGLIPANFAASGYPPPGGAASGAATAARMH
jgi:hypothetical protein